MIEAGVLHTDDEEPGAGSMGFDSNCGYISLHQQQLQPVVPLLPSVEAESSTDFTLVCLMGFPQALQAGCVGVIPWHQFLADPTQFKSLGKRHAPALGKGREWGRNPRSPRFKHL